MPSGIVGKDWRNDLDIKNSSKIMIIQAGDIKVLQIHLWLSSRTQTSYQERTNKPKKSSNHNFWVLDTKELIC